MDLRQIFRSNIQMVLKEWGYSRQQLSELSGVSYNIIVNILSGRSGENLHLRIMQSIADALELPLSLLLKPQESDEWQAILAFRQKDSQKLLKGLPENYVLMKNVILPGHKAAIVEEWEKLAQKELVRNKQRP